MIDNSPDEQRALDMDGMPIATVAELDKEFAILAFLATATDEDYDEVDACMSILTDIANA